MRSDAGVSIERSTAVKDELTLTGNDVDLVSHSAALINGLCHVRWQIAKLTCHRFGSGAVPFQWSAASRNTS